MEFLLGLLVLIAVVGIVAYGAWWVITKFFPEPLRTIALVVVGLFVLLYVFGVLSGSISTPALLDANPQGISYG